MDKIITSDITKAGQTTVPREILEALGLRPGDRIIYQIRDGEVVLHPLKVNFFDLRGTIQTKGIENELEVARIAARKWVAERGAKRGL